MATNDPSPVAFLADPLSSIARAERRNLLIASTIGLLVAKAGLVPTQFSTFGLQFQQPEQSALIWLVFVTIAYFAIAFTLYGLADFLVWRKIYQDYLEGVEHAGKSWTQKDQEAYDELRRSVSDIDWLYRWSKPSAIVRILFEFVVPLLVAIFAAVSLVQRLETL